MLVNLWRRFCDKVKNFDIKPSTPRIIQLIEKAEQLHDSGELQQANDMLVEALAIKPDSERALIKISFLSLEAGWRSDAKKYINFGLKCYPDRAVFHKLNGILHLRGDELDKSIAALEKALEISPNSEEVQYLLSSAKGEAKITVPRDHIAKVFNNYAKRFEVMLQDGLKYKGPQQLVDFMLSKVTNLRNIFVLDLGCGTGLLGQYLSKSFGLAKLHGVDLSDKMLEVCQTKKIYEQLIQSDLIIFLQQCKDKYDIIGSTDVFIYLGELFEVLNYSYRCLIDGGWLCFTVESLESGDFHLAPEGRFKHSLDYVDQLQARIGFVEMYSKPVVLRKEQGDDVHGYLILLKK